MDLIKKLEQRARELDRQVQLSLTRYYDKQAADDRELLQSAANELRFVCRCDPLILGYGYDYH